MEQTLKSTPLLDEHRRDRGKLIPFAGWQMPVEYSGILNEHRAVRGDKGLFDLSHMGEIEVSGAGALSYLEGLVAGHAGNLEQGQALYTVMCREDGGILDDLVVYRFKNKFMLVVNASNIEKIFAWMEAHCPQADVTLANRSDEIALLAVQGPRAESLLQTLSSVDLKSIPYYHAREGNMAGIPGLISRTGYTGEDGFEFYVENQYAPKIWRLLREKGVPPIGLGARDTLRLEAGYLLYGNDMDETASPLDVGLSWVVKLDKGAFIGREALQKQKAQGVMRKLIAFAMEDRSVPRKGYTVFSEGESVGVVTSGTFSPSLEKGIGFALVKKESPLLQILIRGEMHPAKTTRKPFVKGSVKRA